MPFTIYNRPLPTRRVLLISSLSHDSNVGIKGINFLLRFDGPDMKQSNGMLYIRALDNAIKTWYALSAILMMEKITWKMGIQDRGVVQVRN